MVGDELSGLCCLMGFCLFGFCNSQTSYKVLGGKTGSVALCDFCGAGDIALCVSCVGM